MSKYDPATSSGTYRWYVVFALAAVFAINVMDRSLVTILQEPIKHDLGLSDAQLGSLTGLAFAAFYATLAIPIARLADRTNRTLVLCGALTLWSVMTVGCGAASGFLALLLFRMGVGVGEAGGYPPSASILSDYFSKHRRATALALFGLGAPIGHTFGLFSGGWLNEAVGWRNAFYIVGAAGVLMAPLVFFTVREPRRGAAEEVDAKTAETTIGTGAEKASLLEVATVLWRLKSIRYLFTANMCHGFVFYAHSAWSPPFYGRVFGLPIGEVAHWLGMLSILGAVGTFCGGAIADRLAKRDSRWSIWIMAVASLILAPTAIAQFLAPSVQLSLALAIIPSFLLTFFVGPTIATGQSMVQPHMRATTAAIMLMLYNIFGLGLGPLFVGVLSDLFGAMPDIGKDGLRYAVVIGLLVELVAVGFYIAAGRHLPKDSARDRSLDFTPRQALVADPVQSTA